MAISPTPSWTTHVATALSAGAAAYALALATGRVARPSARALRLLGATALVSGLGLATVSGGVASPAVLLLGLGVLALVGRPAAAAVVGALSLAAVAGLHARAAGAPSLDALLTAAAVIAGAGVVPRWLSGRAAREISQARRRAAGMESFLATARTTPLGSRVVTDGPVAADRIEELARDRTQALSRLLADVRDATGADEAVYWRRARGGDSLVAVAWSGDEAVAARVQEAAWLPLVAWSADQRLLQMDETGGAIRMAAAPAGDVTDVAAISVSSRGGLRMSRDELKRWLPRYGAQVEQLIALLELREEYARQGHNTKALLEAAHQFQSNRSIEALGASVCNTALSITSGTRAALVRWHGAEGRGEVQHVSAGHPVRSPIAVTPETHVGRMCETGLPQVWEDARRIDRAAPVYGPGEAPRQIGSLGIVPLKRGHDVTGAIVIEGDAPGDVLMSDLRTVRVLAALAAVSLETVWEIEEVSRRARTDPLTGLANRRSFDEQLDRVLAETDRFGGSASLILVDLDHFKHVNDTHGHAAGDRALQLVAETLQEGVRAVDICARFGGEELAILLPQTPLGGAVELAERLRRAIERRPVAYEGSAIPVTASLGVATYPDSARARDAFFPAADRALYRAKHEGRNCVRSAPVIHSARPT